MGGQLDVDWDVLEKIGWAVLAFAMAEACTEVAKTLREQRHRAREIEAPRAGVGIPPNGIDLTPVIAAQLGLAPAPVALIPVTAPRAIRGQG